MHRKKDKIILGQESRKHDKQEYSKYDLNFLSNKYTQ